MSAAVYLPRRRARSRFVDLRGLRYHLLEWGDARLAGARPTLVLLHGWMDVGASFQFVVDALAGERHVVAPDWRGFGLSANTPADAYWFPDYLGDLDALLDTLSSAAPVDLLGHSMGGNVAMLYAGIRPQRVRRLVNLEGFGLPASRPEDSAGRYAEWLDELKQPQSLRSYAGIEAVAARLMQNNPRLTAERAAWLAPHWARRADDGSWHLLADPTHKRRNPVPYQQAETLEIWRRIAAPLLWAEGGLTDLSKWWGQRYTRADFEARLAVVREVERHSFGGSGHMLHHDQPEDLARCIAAFLDRG